MNSSKTTATSASEVEHKKSGMDSLRLRNFIGFWLLGLCNNYAYCVMLGAAHDILSEYSEKIEKNDDICNPQSTGIILLLDILPSLMVKSFSPFISGYTRTKILLNIFCSLTSYLLTGLATNQIMAYVGVAFASLASGLGEVAILGYLSKFNPNAISAWSSGTGGAGLFASTSYFLLTKIHFSPKQSILIMLVVPFIMFFSFFFIIVEEDDTTSALVDKNTFEVQEGKAKKISLMTKIGLLKSLLKYMIPMFFVYYFEYFINQGLSELLNFKNSVFNHDEQYRLYQVEYQLGVLISRSSVNFIQIDKIWILPILQGINLIIILGHILHPFLPMFWITSCIIIFEGLIGGAAYVNTFSKIKKTDEIAPNHKEFCMSMTCFADTLGISLSGLTAIPTHNLLCAYMKKHY